MPVRLTIRNANIDIKASFVFSYSSHILFNMYHHPSFSSQLPLSFIMYTISTLGLLHKERPHPDIIAISGYGLYMYIVTSLRRERN